ncbi:type III toxin-antitoxin system ToxN/AbiQ family toxin [Proteiniborus sp. MB09-C3]|uniref:type III toxin-antitoxin system ToxN/AbiQ family toxin n=1 Tax=Proteiniborus sp. MB09-C3 TaxID=3050072 RepID=UPI0025533343|nr:type III toxin-antitoxin system ToxN/AbiQ family toxin [Proteiniborus sp. MB09-C3]WIV11076.1 type III toxin-antitoxin system ToxN/AbiQ family toxin [Proteiniborus sp. MB09-C3]
MDKLMFYEVSQQYINYLKLFEPKIPNIDYNTHNKFVCGVIFSIDGFNYFAPISSFKEQQKTNIIINNSNGEAVSSIRFSFMFPIPEAEIKIKDFSKEEYKYRRLLLEEFKYCNIIRDKIISKAKYTYKRYNSGYDKMLMKNCCNFRLLEEKCLEYQVYLDTAREVAAVREENMDIEKKIKDEDNYEMER